MGYHLLDPDDLDPSPEHPCDRRGIADAAELAQLAAAMYELAPGEQLATQYHYHDQREELFYVVAGDLHVETPEETFVVPPDQVFVVEPESPIRPFNPADATESVRVLGVGAPKFDIGNPYEPEEAAASREQAAGSGENR